MPGQQKAKPIVRTALVDSALEDARLIQTLDPATFGRRLRTARIAAQLRQSDLGRGDLSAAYVSRLEAGTRRPSLDVVTKLADRLGVPLSALLRAEDERTWVVRETVESVMEWTVQARTAEEAMALRTSVQPDLIEEGNSSIEARRAGGSDAGEQHPPTVD